MLRTITLSTDIPDNRQVMVALPDDIPTGPAEIVVVVATQRNGTVPTLGDLLNSEFFGMWRDRDDIKDSADFARQLRQDAWKRPT